MDALSFLHSLACFLTFASKRKGAAENLLVLQQLHKIDIN